jgi:hypothetical protein
LRLEWDEGVQSDVVVLYLELRYTSFCARMAFF